MPSNHLALGTELSVHRNRVSVDVKVRFVRLGPTLHVSQGQEVGQSRCFCPFFAAGVDVAHDAYGKTSGVVFVFFEIFHAAHELRLELFQIVSLLLGLRVSPELARSDGNEIEWRVNLASLDFGGSSLS